MQKIPAIAAFQRLIAPGNVRFFKRMALGGICALLLFYACTDIRDVSSPGGRPHSTRLAVVPRFSLVAGSYLGEPINRIRLVARNRATGEIVGSRVLDVLPNDDAWDVSLDVTLAEQIEVVVSIELINVTAGVEAVQWSGMSAPITVAPTQTAQPPAPVPVFQGPLDNLAVTDIDITAGALQLQEGGTTQFQATVAGPPASLVVWNSRDAAIVSIDQAGRATALRNGSTWIVASAGPKSDSVPVQISQRLNSVSIAPDTTRIGTIGADAVYSARGLDPRGGEIANSAMTWSIANANIADNLGNGRFRARANGTTQVTATSVANPAISRSATLIVAQRAARLDLTPTTASLNSIGARQTFDAVVRDGGGNVVTQSVRWRSANTAIATVDNAGIATATGIGTTQIIAASGTAPDTVFAAASLQVTQAIASISASPGSATLDAVGDTAVFTLTARDANNNIVPNVQGVWSSANPLAVTVDSLGRAIAIGNGSATLTAQVGTLRASVSVTVAQRVIAVTVRPTPNTLNTAGQQVQLTAAATDRRNAVVTGRRTLWTSSDTSVANVDSTGKVTARRNGTTNVRAEIDGVAGLGTVNVNIQLPDLIVSSATFTPRDSIGLNDSTLFAFEIRNNGNAVAGASHAALQLVDASRNVVVDDTIVTLPAMAAGQAFVLSRWFHHDGDPGTPDSLRIRIVADTLKEVAEADETNNVGTTATMRLVGGIASFDATPDSVLLNAITRTSQLTAQARSRAGVVVPSAIIRWFSKNPGVVGVDSLSGLVTARNAGFAYVMAFTGNGFKDSVLVRVRQVPARITVNPPTRNLAPNDTARFFSQVFDSANAIIPNAKPAWTSSDNGVATVDSTGLARGVAGGTANITATTSNGLFASGSVSITMPDLVVLSLTMTPGDSLADNDSAFVSVQIKNVGTGSAPVSRTSLRFLNAGTNAVVSDTLVALPVLGPNQFFTITRWLKPGSSDSLRVRVVADTLGEVAESNEANNAVASQVVHIRLRAVSLDVTPDSLVLNSVTASGQLAATIRDRNNQPMTTVRPIWFSMNPGVITVDSLGHVSAHNFGSAFVVAVSGLLRDSSLVSVRDTSTRNLTFRAGSIKVQPDSAFEGAAVIITGTVLNTGSAATGPSTLALRVVNASTSALVYAAPMPIPGVAAHDSFVVVLPLLVDTMIAWPDTLRGIATLDTANVIAESNEGDNTFSTAPVKVRFRVAALDITPTTRTIVLNTIGDTAIGVIPRDRYGRALLDRPIGYFSRQPSTIQVDGTGHVHVTAADSAYIVIVSEARIDSVRVVVRQVAQNVVIVSGDNQINTVDHEVNDSLAVLVEDANHHGVAGVNVEWTVDEPASNLVENAGPSANVVAAFNTTPIITQTNSNGIAKRPWRLGTRSGNQSMRACIAGNVCATFNGKARADKAFKANKRAQSDNQDVIVNRVAPNALEISVLDKFDNPTRGTVEFSLGAGHGTFTTPSTVAIDTVTGKAIVQWQLPTVKGQYTVNYTVRDETSAIVATGDFKANAKPDKANKGNKGANSDDQIVTVAQIAANALQLTITDQFDNPIEGATVNWSLHAGHVAGTLSAPSSVTDANGNASVAWNVGTKSGPVQVDYTIKDVDNSVLVSGNFKARARAAKANKANKANDEQEVIVNRVAPNALELTVLDQYDNPTRGTVEFALSAGHGSLTTPATVAIDTLTGKATVSWQLPTTKGQYNVNYTVKDEQNAVVTTGTFKANAKPDKANKGTKGANTDDQIVTVAQTAANALQLTITDQFDNPIEGATINWSLHAGHVAGTLSAASSVTDANGNASVSWNVGTKSGPVQVDYTIKDIDNTVLVSGNFKARARAAKANKANKANDNQEVIVNRVAPNALELTVLDEFDNPTRGTVEFSVGAGHGAFTTPATVAIDTVTGKALVSWQLPTTKGQYTVNYTVKDELNAVVTNGTFKANAKPDKANKGNKGANTDDQTVTVAQTAPNALQLTITDQFDNPIEGATVNWSLHTGHVGGTLSAPSSVTDANGNASVSWNVGTKSGPVQVDYTIKDVDNTVLVSGNFKARARAAKASKANKANDEQDVIVNRVAPNALELTVLDEYDNPTRGTVNFAINEGHGTLTTAATVAIDTMTGKAAVSWQVPTTKGQYSVSYVVKDELEATVAEGSFKANAKPDKPNKGNKGENTDDQSVTVAQTAANALQLTITDQYDNPVEGATVNWSLHTGHVAGSLTSPTSVTDTDGNASVSWNVGTKAGPVQVDYTVKDVDNTVLVTGSFHATANPGARAKVKGTQDSTFVDALEQGMTLTAKTYDQYDNERTGDAITFSSASALVQVGVGGSVTSKGNGKAYVKLTSGAIIDSVIVAIAQRAKHVSIDGKNNAGADTIDALQFTKQVTHKQKDRNNIDISQAEYLSQTTWTSLNPGVATITQTATEVTLTSVSNGIAKVMVTLNDDPAVKDSIFVVVDQRVATTGTILIVRTADGANLNGTSYFAGTVVNVRANGFDAKNNRVRNYTWTTSDPSIAAVVPFAGTDSAQVVLTGNLGSGSTTIEVKDKGNKTATATISKTLGSRPVTPPIGIDKTVEPKKYEKAKKPGT